MERLGDHVREGSSHEGGGSYEKSASWVERGGASEGVMKEVIGESQQVENEERSSDRVN